MLPNLYLMADKPIDIRLITLSERGFTPCLPKRGLPRLEVRA